MIAALLLALQAAPDRAMLGAAQPAAPTREQEAVGQFASACFDGALRTSVPYREIQRSEAPSALRGRYREGFSGHYYRIGADRPSYLIVLATTASTDDFRSVCGLAVPGMRLGTLFNSAIESLTGRRYAAAAMQSASSATFSNPDDGYVVTGEIVGGYTLLEVFQYRDPGKLPVR